MMASSKYASTRETTSLARVARIILGPCTGVLCEILKKEISPSTLSQKVSTYLARLPKGIQPTITKEQEKIIHNGNYSDFDITFLYFLSRNISTILPHAKQWGNDPIPNDRSVSANIEIIRMMRNKYGHCPDFSILDTLFNQKIIEILGIIQDLEKYLGTCTIYHDAVVKKKTCCMDPELDSIYIKELLNLDKQIKDISGSFFFLLKRHVHVNENNIFTFDERHISYVYFITIYKQLVLCIFINRENRKNRK